MELERRLASGEFKTNEISSLKRKRTKMIKNIEALVEVMTELKKLFNKLQTEANSILFTQETINEKLIKKTKKVKI